MTDQADFMNGAVKIGTNMEIEKFRLYLKELEDRLGRDRSQPKYGPRSIDLDILIWNGEIVDEELLHTGIS
ncbi:MAG: 2-amino-4-hydroxy-6-hydroxymethyldihydropteridine diphosphokinase [Mangrovibacterium sp.]